MTTTILAPVDLSAATQTGPRVFRKQILAKRTIQYPGKDGTKREIAFDDAYLTDLAAAFRAGAYDNVPFILADEQNRHTMAPERFRGWVKGVEVTPDGLDAIIELSADAAELVERTGGKLGVSARIRPVEHVDGRRFDKAVNHVLGTLDPRMTGMGPWEPVDLSADPTDDVLDLSGASYQEGTTMPRIDLANLSDDEYETLVSFAAVNGIDLSEPDAEPDAEPDDVDTDVEDEETGDQDATDEPEGDEDEPTDEDEAGEITDEELDALIDAELAEIGVSLSEPDEALEDEGDEETDEVDLSVEDVDPVATERRTSAKLRFELTARDLTAAGVPPHLIDLAEPILSLSDDEADTIDLSTPTGEHVDVRGIVRDMLDAVKGTIDLSRENGYGHDDDQSSPQEDATAQAWIAHLENN